MRAKHLAKESARRARKQGAAVEGVTASQLRDVLERDPLCTYCGGCPSTTVDHITALADGGTHSFANLVGACKPCNSSKSVHPITNWAGRVCQGCGLLTAAMLDAGVWPDDSRKVA